jgi:hypothetical protein
MLGRVFFLVVDLQPRLRAAPVVQQVFNLIIQTKTSDAALHQHQKHGAYSIYVMRNTNTFSCVLSVTAGLKLEIPFGGEGLSIMAFVGRKGRHRLPVSSAFYYLHLYQNMESTRSVMSQIRSQLQRFIMNAS